MAVTRHKSRVAYFAETTPGTGPADWQASGTKIHLSAPPDVSGIEQTLLADERTVPRMNERAGPPVKGLRQTSMQVRTYWTGHGQTVVGAQVAATALGTLLEHCLGAVHRSSATTLAAGGHTTTVINVAATTNISVGCLIGVRDDSDTDGKVAIRRVTAIAALAVTLDEALPFTPVDGDDVVAGITAYIDPDVLEDSSGASGRTLSWVCDYLASNGAAAVVELLGTKAALSIDGFARNERPSIVLDVTAARFRNVGQDGLAAPSWSGSPATLGPVVLGPRTKLWLQDYGATTQTTGLHLSSASWTVGVSVAPVEVITEQTAGMPGIGLFSTAPARPECEVTIVPWDDDYDVDLAASTPTYKAIRVALESTEGKSIAIMFPRAQIMATPKIAQVGEVLGATVKLEAHEDADAIGTTDLAKSPILIGLF